MDLNDILNNKANDLAAGLPMDSLPGIDTQLEEQNKKAKKKLKKKRAAVRQVAVGLIHRCAKLFLDNNMIKEDDYVKYRMEVDVMTLTNTLMQLHTAHIAIEDLCLKIQAGSSNSRHFETLAGLQRVVLDINKFLSSNMAIMEQSYLDLRERIIDINIEKATGDGGEVSEDTSGSSISISTRNRIELIEQLAQYEVVADNISKVPSNNPRLIRDDDDPEGTYNDEIDRNSGEEEDSNNDHINSFDGFDGY